MDFVFDQLEYRQQLEQAASWRKDSQIPLQPDGLWNYYRGYLENADQARLEEISFN